MHLKMNCGPAQARLIFIAKIELKYLYGLTRITNLWFMNSLGQFQQSPSSLQRCWLRQECQWQQGRRWQKLRKRTLLH